MPSDIVLDQITGNLIDKTWPFVEPLLQKAIDTQATDGSTAKIREAIDAGRFLLWAIYRADRPLPLLAAAASYVRPTQHGPIAVIDCLGGDNIDLWMEPALARFEALAKANGCTRIEVDGRLGWKRRLPGYVATRIILQKALI